MNDLNPDKPVIPEKAESNDQIEPEAPHKIKHAHKFIFGYILLLILAAAAGMGGYLYHLDNILPKPVSESLAKRIKPANSYADWKTYTSATEHASFRYPSDWKIIKPYEVSNDSSNTDQVGITSPSGKITISYVTDLTGFGNESTSTYPLNTIIDKTPITNAPGLYVVSGITTLNGNTYYPWIAIQDSDGIVTSGVMGNVVTFTGHHAINSSTDDFTGILFSTSGARTNQNSPAMTKAKAIDWFNTTEAKQAKLILSSLNDPVNPAADWYLYESPDNNYAIRIPDGWDLVQNCTGQYAPLLLYSDNSNPLLAIRPGTKGIVTDQCFGRDAMPTLSIQWYNFADPSDDAQKTLDGFSTASSLQQRVSFQTDAGLTVNKYYMNVTQPGQNLDQPEQGTYYEYVIKNNTGFVWIIYFYPPGATDYHANVEEAVKTLLLNN